MGSPILAAYMAEIVKIPAVTAGEERNLLEKAKEGNRDAMNILVSSHLRFVVAVSWNYRQRGVPLPDLINEGNLALFRAAEHFDLGNPVRCISYAVWWIRQGMMEALRAVSEGIFSTRGSGPSIPNAIDGIAQDGNAFNADADANQTFDACGEAAWDR